LGKEGGSQTREGKQKNHLTRKEGELFPKIQKGLSLVEETTFTRR